MIETHFKALQEIFLFLHGGLIKKFPTDVDVTVANIELVYA